MRCRETSKNPWRHTASTAGRRLSQCSSPGGQRPRVRKEARRTEILTSVFSPALTGCQQRKGKCFRWKPAVPMLAVKAKGSGNARLKKDSNHSSNEKRNGRLPHIVSDKTQCGQSAWMADALRGARTRGGCGARGSELRRLQDQPGGASGKQPSAGGGGDSQGVPSLCRG